MSFCCDIHAKYCVSLEINSYSPSADLPDCLNPASTTSLDTPGSLFGISICTYSIRLKNRLYSDVHTMDFK